MEDRKKTIEEEAYTLISESLGIPIEAISENSKINDLSDDSIKLFELLLAFEKKYEIKTAYDDIVRLVTVADIVSYLRAHLQKNPA